MPNQEQTAFTAARQRALSTLLGQYRQNHDLFSRQVLARLGFLRWLYQVGRLEPAGQRLPRTDQQNHA